MKNTFQRKKEKKTDILEPYQVAGCEKIIIAISGGHTHTNTHTGMHIHKHKLISPGSDMLMD